MSHGPNILRSPLCSSCIRRIALNDRSQSIFPFHRQVRGKKKSAKRPTTIKVELLEDIKGYGRKGSITPVEPGRMRNTWYPRQKAKYMTVAALQGIKPRDLVAERDFTFGMTPKEQEESVRTEEKEEAPEVRTKLLTPQMASEILAAALPSHLIFYRTPITSPEPETITQEPPPFRRAASSAAADIDAASAPLQQVQKPQLATIFGSVSTTDIVTSIKAILAETDAGSKVVIGAEDVTILEENGEDKGVEGERLKALGDFRVEIRVKGGEPVERTVSVRAQEENSESAI